MESVSIGLSLNLWWVVGGWGRVVGGWGVGCGVEGVDAGSLGAGPHEPHGHENRLERHHLLVDFNLLKIN